MSVVVLVSACLNPIGRFLIAETLTSTNSAALVLEKKVGLPFLNFRKSTLAHTSIDTNS